MIVNICLALSKLGAWCMSAFSCSTLIFAFKRKQMIEEELCNTNNPLKGKNANESNGGIDMSDSDDENVIPSVSANFLGRLWEAVNSDFAFLPSGPLPSACPCKLLSCKAE